MTEGGALQQTLVCLSTVTATLRDARTQIRVRSGGWDHPMSGGIVCSDWARIRAVSASSLS